MKYYLHDSNAFNDEKVSELFINYGYEGVGLFYVILEKLAAQEQPIKTEVLKSQLRVGKRLEKCWKFMESLGIISSNNGETFNERLIKNNEKFLIKREKNRKRIEKFRESKQKEENSNALRNAGVTPPKLNKSKVNKSKGIQKLPNLSINKMIEILLSFTGLSSLDGTEQENRRYCWLLIKNKIKPEFIARRGQMPSDNEVMASLTAILRGADNFQKKKLTNFKYLYYNFGEIIKTAAGNQIIKI